MPVTQHATDQLAQDLVVDVPHEATTSKWAQSGAPLRVRVQRPIQATVVITISGDVDASAVPRLRELLEHVLTASPRAVVVDLSSVTFMDSAGVELLAASQHDADRHLIAFCVVTAGTGPVDRVVDLLDARGCFTRYGSVQDALARCVPLDHSPQ